MASKKAESVDAFMQENPDATLKQIMEACDVSKPTAIAGRRAFEDKAGEPVGKGEGTALQSAFPPAASPPAPKPKEEEVKKATPPVRVWTLKFGR